MKKITICSLEIISGGLDNAVYTNTLDFSNDFPCSMLYGQDDRNAYYLFFKGTVHQDTVAYVMRTDLVFDRSAYVEVELFPRGDSESQIVIRSTQNPLGCT